MSSPLMSLFGGGAMPPSAPVMGQPDPVAAFVQSIFGGNDDGGMMAPTGDTLRPSWQQELLKNIDPEEEEKRNRRRALLAASQALMSTPGNALQGVAQAAGAGAQQWQTGQDDAQARRMAAMKMLYDDQAAQKAAEFQGLKARLDMQQGIAGEQRAQEAHDAKMAGGVGGEVEYGLQPIITQDEQGNYHLFQVSKNGGPPKEIPLPYGWTPKLQYLDRGTDYQAVPQVGAGPGQVIPKDLGGAASQTAQGKAHGELAFGMPQAKVKVDSAIKQLDELLKHPGLPAAVGTWQGSKLGAAIGPWVSNNVADFQRRLSQLQGGAFLQAYETLKGGGAIANAEGVKAEQAIARLSTAVSEEDFKTAMNDYKNAIQRGYAAMQQEVGQVEGVPLAPPATGGGAGGGDVEEWTIGPDGVPVRSR